MPHLRDSSEILNFHKFIKNTRYYWIKLKFTVCIEKVSALIPEFYWSDKSENGAAVTCQNGGPKGSSWVEMIWKRETVNFQWIKRGKKYKRQLKIASWWAGVLLSGKQQRVIKQVEKCCDMASIIFVAASRDHRANNTPPEWS